MALAPVIIFCYKRLFHLQQTVSALAGNYLSQESDVFIFSDGYKSDSDRMEVTEVRNYLKTITGFKSVSIIERETNMGLANSIISGVTDIVNMFGKVIVLEDDMVTSPFFLNYMNESLVLYEKNNRVVSVHAYIYPLPGRLPETFFLKDTGCWGWATWKRGWALFESDGRTLLSRLKTRGLIRSFDMNGSYPFSKMLENQVIGKNNSWAIRWQASAFLHDKLTLFPGRSLVKNIGHDGSGVHCASSSCFEVKITESPVYVQEIPVEEAVSVKGMLEVYFRSVNPGLLKRLVAFIKAKVLSLI